MLRKQDQVARSSGRLGLACSTTIHDHDHAQTRPQLRLKWPGATHFSSENHYAEASALSIQPNGKLIRVGTSSDEYRSIQRRAFATRIMKARE